MEPANIPGYYYNPDKRKYFKIVANHLTTPTNHYSKEYVKNVESEAVTAQAQAQQSAAQAQHSEAQATQLVQRFLTSPSVTGLILEREIAQRFSASGMRDSMAKVYGAELKFGWVYEFESKKVLSFAHDPATGHFLVGHQCDEDLNTVQIFKKYKNEDIRLFSAHSSAISSISLSPSRVAVVTCIGGSTRSKIDFMILEDPSKTGGFIEYERSFSFEFPNEKTAWTSAASPFAENEARFVAGLSNSTILFTDIGGSDLAQIETLPSTSDVFALSWLAPSVVSVGHRNGSVKLWDTRSKGSTLRLQHPACITGIKSYGTDKLVICGLQDSLATYDLRMPREEGISPPTKKRRTDVNNTAPAIIFDHKNKTSRFFGFDVEPEKGIVAAADDSGVIRIFSLVTGDRIDRLQCPGRHHFKHDDESLMVTNIQFCKDEEPKYAEYLAAGTDIGLYSMKW